MKKFTLLLTLLIVMSILCGCTLEIPSVLEAKRIVDAYKHYSLTGELTPEIIKILEEDLNNNSHELNGEVQELTQKKPIKILEKAIKTTKKSDVIKLAKKYFEMSYPKIESDTKSEYARLITWEPIFKDKKPSDAQIKLQMESSVNVALALSYLDAKNFYLAMATSVFSLDPDNPTAANNFAAATASYGDDLELESSKSTEVLKYFEDAMVIYQYALMLNNNKGKFTEAALPTLISIGNLFLDNKKFEEAYACFQIALEIDNEYFNAIEGLFNTYMAMNQYKMAMDLLVKTAKYPAFISAKKEIDKRNDPIDELTKAGMPGDENGLQMQCDELVKIEAASVADYLDVIDEEAKQRLKERIRQVQAKMIYEPPEITIISQFASVKKISEPLGESALTAFREGVYQLEDEVAQLEEKIELRQMDDSAFDEFLIESSNYSQTNDPSNLNSMYRALSTAFPEFSVYTLSDNEYTNRIDIEVQRLNVAALFHKANVYGGYLNLKGIRFQEKINDIVYDFYDKYERLNNEMNQKLSKLYDSDNATDKAIHAIHTSYYPKMENLQHVTWNQATQAAATTYQQSIKKYAAQMYNDCMKHIILISDDEIAQILEERLRYNLLNGLMISINAVYDAFSFTSYNEQGCGCDLELASQLDKARRKQEEELAKTQIAKNMEAKKNFENGVLDENSEYYKKIIKPYEVKLNTPFVQGVIGPYKSSFKIKIDLPGKTPAIEFSKVEHHLRNTTTYNGGIEYGLGKKGPAKVYLRASATTDSDGSISLDDVSVSGGVKTSFKKTMISTDIGLEANAVRGTKAYSSLSLDGGNRINSDVKKAAGYWAPNLKKTLWEGKYPILIR